MTKSLSNYIDINYFLRFVLVFLTLNYFNIFFIGIVTKGGLYSPFIRTYLNYPSWLINIMLYFSNIITHLAGINTYVNGIELKVYKGSTVSMYWPCAGLQIMSFWIAFIVAHHNKWKSKLIWCVIGVFAIMITNSLRIALLSIAMERGWKENSYKDHHAMFTLAAYFIIFLIVCVYSSKVKGEIKAG